MKDISPDSIEAAVSRGKRYWLVLLAQGPNRFSDEEGDKLQVEHLKHIFSLKRSGKLLLAGPVIDDVPLRGIEIFTDIGREEVERLVGADPAIIAGSLLCTIHEWFGLPGDGLV